MSCCKNFQPEANANKKQVKSFIRKSFYDAITTIFALNSQKQHLHKY